MFHESIYTLRVWHEIKKKDALIVVLKSIEYIVVGHLHSQRTGSMCTEDKKTKERDLCVEPIRQPEENYIFFPSFSVTETYTASLCIGD